MKILFITAEGFDTPNPNNQMAETMIKGFLEHGYKVHLILLHDSVEWYSPEEFKNGEKNIEYRLKEYTNTKAIHTPWKVISISRYLDSYFKSCGVESVRIPVIMDVINTSYNLKCNPEKTVFVYAGGPGRKDYLKEIISGFALLSKDQLSQMTFYVVGVNEKQLVDVCGVLQSDISTMGTSLVAVGRVPREEAKAYVQKADFTVLLRNDNLRYAKAGFPTKFVESLACGTPVICNLSSDLIDYISDGENGFIVKDYTPQEFEKTISRVLGISIEEKEHMRQEARKTALDCFDFRLFNIVFKTLLNR